MSTWNSITQTFINKSPACRANSTCDLKRFTLYREDYVLPIDGEPNFGTRAWFEYQTKTKDDLKKYVIVQFIKGSVYRTFADGIMVKIDRRHFGESAYYLFPDWVIDSEDTDAAYASDMEHGRWYHYRWTIEGQDRFDDDIHVWSYEEHPKSQRSFYLTDRITAYIMNGGAKNVDLQFKTCVYKASEVPASTTPDNLTFARPIHCFEWRSYHVYDHTERIYRNTPAK